MSFTESLINSLKEKGEKRNKPISDSSIKLYVRNLEKLNGNKPLKSFVFLKNVDNVKKQLEAYKPNTQRSYLISIVSSLATEPKLKKLYDTYFKMMIELAGEIRSIPTEEKTETQSKNWIEWDEVLKVYNDLKAQAEGLPKKIKTEEQYNTLLHYVILSLYVLVPPRRNIDYMKMVICKNVNTNDENVNILDLNKKQFIFNIYKTAKNHGKTIIDIPNELMDVIDLYIKHHKMAKGKKLCIPFLVDYNDKPLTNINSITYIINKIFNKKIGSSMLRHIYLSGKYGDELKERQKDANMMGHTTDMATDYIKTK